MTFEWTGKGMSILRIFLAVAVLWFVSNLLFKPSTSKAPPQECKQQNNGSTNLITVPGKALLGGISSLGSDFSPILLKDGRILFQRSKNPLIFEPQTTSFKKIDRPWPSQSGQDPIILNNGKVLFIGGHQSEVFDQAKIQNVIAQGGYIKENPHVGTRSGLKEIVHGDEIEIFSPENDTFQVRHRVLPRPRASYTSVLLNNDSVLLIGGGYPYTGYDLGGGGGAHVCTPANEPCYYDEVWKYDFKSNKATPSGKLMHARQSHSSMLLDNGKVLVIGGHIPGRERNLPAEVFNPVTQEAKALGPIPLKRINQTFKLSNGDVLLLHYPIDYLLRFNAKDPENQFRPLEAALYNVRENKFEILPSVSGKIFVGSTPILLPDDRILIVGGSTCSRQNNKICPASNAISIYEPKTGHVKPGGSLARKRAWPYVVSLGDKRVAVIGGSSCDQQDNTLEFVDLKLQIH